jgi:hypothetical protein
LQSGKIVTAEELAEMNASQSTEDMQSEASTPSVESNVWDSKGCTLYATSKLKFTVWLSSAFYPHEPAAPSTHKSSTRNRSPEFIRDFLEERGISVILSKDCISQETVDLGLPHLRRSLMKGLMNADIFLACITPEYLSSEIHQQELRYARDVLKLPIVFASVAPFHLKDSNGDDEFDHFMNTVAGDLPWVNLTNEMLVASRLFVLENVLLQSLDDYERRIKMFEDRKAERPEWTRTFLDNIKMGNLVEGFECVAMENPTVSDGESEYSKNDHKLIYGLCWTSHVLLLGKTFPDSSYCQNLISTGDAAWLGPMGWTTSVASNQVNESGLSTLPFRWVQTTRYRSYRASRTMAATWKVGSSVEVSMYWENSDGVSQYLW